MLKKIIKENKDFLVAVATIIGTAIGAGIFGLPYITAKAGFFPVIFIFFILGISTIISNLMYGEITLRTKKKGRLVGYSEKYLGVWGKRVSAVSVFFSFYSGLLVYIILGGIFLNSLLSGFMGGSEFLYSLALFAFVSLAIYFNLSLFSIVESWMVLFLIFVMSGIIFKTAHHIDVGNFLTSDPSQFFLPFGVILFSLGATSAIPEMEHIIKRKRSRIKKAILWGTISYIAIYLVFVTAIVGVTGGETTEETFVGLSRFLGDGVITFGLIFGFLAVLTSYLVTGISLKETFWYDYGLSERKAWFLTCSLPLVVFVLGLRDFIKVVMISGSITGGLSGILIILIFYIAKRKGDNRPPYQIHIPEVVSALMIFIYFLGIIYQFFYLSW